MTPRNAIRTAVAALGLALVVHGTLQALDDRDDGAAPCTPSLTAACPTAGEAGAPAGS